MARIKLLDIVGLKDGWHFRLDVLFVDKRVSLLVLVVESRGVLRANLYSIETSRECRSAYTEECIF